MARAGATVINRGSGVIGEVRAAMLSEADFQAQFGTDWVLANGDPCVGSKYETLTGNSTVPDMGGRVLRGKNNGNGINPVERALGDTEEDTTKMPDTPFAAVSNGNHQHDNGAYQYTALNFQKFGAVAGAVTRQQSNNTNVSNQSGLTSDTGAHPHTISGGDTETRMKNVTVNYFIKIN